jgi:hypothetical protein
MSQDISKANFQQCVCAFKLLQQACTKILSMLYYNLVHFATEMDSLHLTSLMETAFVNSYSK